MASRPSLLLCLWLAVVAVTTAQDRPESDPQQPTFRTTIQSVRVDLYATRDGKPVTDLKQNEIELFEDGVPQSIQTFERIEYATRDATTSATDVEQLTINDGRRRANDPRSRLFVVFLPTRTSGMVTGAGGGSLIRQINDLLGPNDLAAVMTPYMPVGDLTFLRRLPLNDEAWFEDQENDPKNVLWDACFPPGESGSPNFEMKARYRELMTLEALDSLVAHLGGLRDERKHVVVPTSGFRLYRKNSALGSRMSGGTRLPLIGGAPVGVLPRLGDAIDGPSFPRQCETDLSDLASLNNSNRLTDIAEHARRNNVSFHPISPAPQRRGGRSTGRPFDAQAFSNATPFEAQAALRDLAEGTDGLAIINTNDIGGGLKRIMSTTSSYYLLSYSPANGAADGKYRRISVKVTRSNTRVRARPGYVALTPLDSRTPEPVAPSKPIDPAYAAVNALALGRTGELHVRSSPWMRTEGSGSAGALWLVAELDPQVRSRAPWTRGGSAQVTLRPVSGGTPVTRSVEITAQDPIMEFDFAGDTPLAPGLYSAQLEVVARDGEPVGDFVRFTIPGDSSPLGESVLSRRTNAPGRLYTRTADPRFRKNELARIELPSNAADPAVARLLDSKGAALPVKLQVTERADASGAFRWLVVDLPMAPLALAYYAVEVTQGSATRVTAFRVVP